MDKTFQDIHFIDINETEYFVLRMVQIQNINMTASNLIEIVIKETNIEKSILLPKMRGFKLLID